MNIHMTLNDIHGSQSTGLEKGTGAVDLNVRPPHPYVVRGRPSGMRRGGVLIRAYSPNSGESWAGRVHMWERVTVSASQEVAELQKALGMPQATGTIQTTPHTGQ